MSNFFHYSKLKPLIPHSDFHLKALKVQNLPLRLHASQPLPSSETLRPKCRRCYDQGTLNDCTSNAELHAYFVLTKGAQGDLSRLMHYYGERLQEMSPDQIADVGADPYDGGIFFANNGICEENLWPYDVSKVNVRPTPDAWSHASYKIKDVRRLGQNDLNQFKLSIHSGVPVVLGINIYSGFYATAVARTGEVQMPQPFEYSMGGHCILGVGYDDSKSRITCQNSWGENWGDKGFFTLPYDYLTNPSYTLCMSVLEM
jgi:C1A family cysteine protease